MGLRNSECGLRNKKLRLATISNFYSAIRNPKSAFLSPSKTTVAMIPRVHHSAASKNEKQHPGGLHH